jgi:hypothetical protein
LKQTEATEIFLELQLQKELDKLNVDENEFIKAKGFNLKNVQEGIRMEPVVSRDVLSPYAGDSNNVMRVRSVDSKSSIRQKTPLQKLFDEFKGPQIATSMKLRNVQKKPSTVEGYEGTSLTSISRVRGSSLKLKLDGINNNQKKHGIKKSITWADDNSSDKV